MLLIGFTSGAFGQDLSHYSSIKEIRALDENALTEGHQVTLAGVVVGRNQGARRLLIQEDGAGLGMVTPRGLKLPPLGARIRVTGRTVHTVGAMVACDEVTVLESAGEVPEPVVFSIAQAMDRTNDSGRLVQVSAFAQGLRPALHDTDTLLDNRVRVQLRENHQVLTVLILTGSEVLATDPRLGKLTVTGVLTDVTLPGAAPLRCLWLLSSKGVLLDQAGPTAPFDGPLPQIEPYLSGETYTNREPMKVRGRVWETLSDDQFTIQIADDSDATILCRNAPRAMRTNDVIELLGYPVSTDEGVRIDVAQVRRLALPAPLAKQHGRSPPLASYVPINTDITRLRTLDASEAERGMPFEIRGLVTYHDAVHPFFYLQHYSGDGVRVVWRGTKDLPAYSDQVTVFGHATNGLRIP